MFIKKENKLRTLNYSVHINNISLRKKIIRTGIPPIMLYQWKQKPLHGFYYTSEGTDPLEKTLIHLREMILLKNYSPKEPDPLKKTLIQLREIDPLKKLFT